MSMIHIDETKCKADGFCVMECPVGILKQRDKKSNPEMVKGGAEVCLQCGHCVAVCPHGAFNHTKIPLDVSPSIAKELVISQEQAEQFLRSRRSIRNFKKKPVEKEKIQLIIDNARYAPTGSNSQEVTWTVHSDENAIQKMADLTVDWMRTVVNSGRKGGVFSYMPLIIASYEAGVDSITRNAPCMIFASVPKNNGNGMVDLSIALSYLELIAVPFGLGSCWAGLVTRAWQFSDPLKALVGLPEAHSNVYAMMLGYPKFRYHRLPERKPASIFWN